MSKLKKALGQQKKQTKQVEQEIYGSLGIPLGGQRLVNVPNRQGFVYVKLRDNQNEVIQVFNNQVAASYDLPVIVVRVGNKYVIKGVNTERYQNNNYNSAPLLPAHGTSHSFAEGAGADVTWVFSRQNMPLLVHPSRTTGSIVEVAKHPMQSLDGSWKLVGGTGTSTLLTYRPTGTQAIMALVYMDAQTGNPGLLVGSGTAFDNVLTGSNSIYQYIPRHNPANQIPLAAVRMDTGTYSLGWENLYDLRQWVRVSPTGSASTPAASSGFGVVGQDEGVFLGTGSTINFVGAGVNATISGSVIRVNVPGSGVDQIGIYGLSNGTPLGTGASIDFRGGINASITGTTLYAFLDFGTGSSQVAAGSRGVTNGDLHDHSGGDGGTISYSSLSDKPTSETNTADIFSCTTAGGVSAFAGTIATLPGGATLTYNVSSGQEGVMVPANTNQLAKMRLYNTTRGTSALISNCNTATNTLTLTANVPAGWQVGDVITVASQTVSGGGESWVDLEVTSGILNRENVFVFAAFTGSAAGNTLRFHPFETYANSKSQAVYTQVAAAIIGGTVLIKINSNVFSIAWTGSPTLVTIRERGYLS